MENNGVYLIAEAGVNHNGDVDLARQMIALAAKAGADAVKFQTFSTPDLLVKNAPKAEYQKTEIEQSQYEMLASLELSQSDFNDLKSQADALNIDFMTTAFDSMSLAFVKGMQVPYLKIPSGELTNLPFLIDHAQSGLPIILSTGMADLEEISTALSAIEWGRTHANYPSSTEYLKERCAGLSDYSVMKTTILHCTSAYPAPLESLNLRAIQQLKQQFGLPVGYSDHSQGNIASVTAIGLGAVVLEKHFTLDPAMKGPDHLASMSPHQLVNWVEDCRAASLSLGNAVKKTHAIEKDVKIVARKSVVARAPIRAGDVFSTENLTLKRPGTGLPPEYLFQLIGQTAEKDYEPDEFIG